MIAWGGVNQGFIVQIFSMLKLKNARKRLYVYCRRYNVLFFVKNELKKMKIALDLMIN